MINVKEISGLDINESIHLPTITPKTHKRVFALTKVIVVATLKNNQVRSPFSFIAV